MVARLHGDQFAIMLVDLDQTEDASRVAEKVISVVAGPIAVGERSITTSANVGEKLMSLFRSVLSNQVRSVESCTSKHQADCASKSPSRALPWAKPQTQRYPVARLPRGQHGLWHLSNQKKC